MVFQSYERDVGSKLNFLERLLDGVSSTDERIDALARVIIEMGRPSRGGNGSAVLPGSFSKNEKDLLENSDLVAYEIRTYPLDTARTDFKVTYEGRFLHGWTPDGVLDNIGVRLNNEKSETLFLDRFNPIPFPFTQFYLTTPAATGKNLFILLAKSALSPGAVTSLTPARTEVPISKTEGKITEAAQAYQTLATWTVANGKNGILYGCEFYSSNFPKTDFRLTIGGVAQWGDDIDVELPVGTNVHFADARVASGLVVLLEGRSNDGTSVDIWGLIDGKEVG